MDLKEKYNNILKESKEYSDNIFIKKYAHKDETSREDVYNRFERELSPHLNYGRLLPIMEAIRSGRIVAGGSIAFGLGNNEQKCSFSNCYFIPIKSDSVDGIYDCEKELAKTFKARGGSGTDLTILRPKNSSVNNAALYSTGSVSFMPTYSNCVNTIGQNNRRGALLITIDIRHPDVIDFIWSKSKPEKVFEKDILTGRLPDISGANISVKVTNDFIKAVENDEEWTLFFPDHTFEKYDDEWDGDYDKWLEKGYPVVSYQKINARELLHQIAESAWISGDPGVVFIDTVKKWSTGYFDPKLTPKGFNPCLPGWAPVLTPNGYTYFRDLENEVLINNEIYGCSDLIKTNENGEVYEVELKSGLKLYATANHKVQKVEYKNYRDKKEIREVKLGDLKIGDSLKTDYSKIKYDFDQDEWDKGYICGLIYSDGCFQYRNNHIKSIELYLGEKEIPQEEEFKELIKKTIGVDVEFNDHPQTSKCKIGKIDKKENFSKILDWFEVEKKYEIDLFKKTTSFQLGFINALIGHDGYVLNKKSKQQQILINQSGNNGYRILSYIQLILNSLGIYSRLGISNHQKLDNRGYNNKTSWNLQIIDVSNFVKIFNIFHREKNEKIEQLSKDITFNKEKRINTLKYCQKIKKIRKLEGTYPVYDIQVPGPNKFVSSGAAIKNCGEQPLADYNNCLLSAIVIYKYVKKPFTKDAEFDVDLFLKDVKNGIIFLDTLSDINAEKHPLKEQREADKYGKRLGQEITGLADMWAMLGYTYGSQEALDFIDEIYYFKAVAEIETSIELAKEKGCAPCLRTKKARRNFIKQPYIRRILSKLVKNKRKSIEENIIKYGLRNSAFSTLGPTGTISIISGNCTSGIEPLFALGYYRQSRITNDKQWIYHYPLLLNTDEKILEMDKEQIKKKYNYLEAFDLDYTDRVKVQSVMQKWTDSAVSSTINLPNDSNVSDIYNIYLMAFYENLKGITIFREGSKKGIFSKDSESENESKVKDNLLLDEQDLINHLKTIKEKISGKHRAYRVVQFWKGIKIYVTITVDENEKPLEVFVNLPYEAGFSDISDESTYSTQLYMERNSTWTSVTRLVSLALRANIPLEKVINQLKKSSPTMVDLPSILLRSLKPFIGTSSEEIKSIKENKTGGSYCPNCEQNTVIFQGGCSVCLECGNSNCG